MGVKVAMAQEDYTAKKEALNKYQSCVLSGAQWPRGGEEEEYSNGFMLMD